MENFILSMKWLVQSLINSKSLAMFRLAVNRPFANQNGEREADFINCVAWRKQAENLANYMRKGSLVGIDGRIQTGSYEDQDGKKVFYTEVVAESIQFLESKNTPNSAQNQFSSQGNTNYQSSNQNAYSGQNQPNNDPFNTSFPDAIDDNLPF
ncbi:single-stranded DNA-binding protein [Ureibacillus thermophilus]|uniref:Single-stranded DNA-binding protein n=2 Tax=Ureibacillus thermophilus TaxID=367743 RepID=A0A4P6UY34_9BACL|nr:single-stranded DNA-binding protein [Ureibacillus thermophilus]